MIWILILWTKLAVAQNCAEPIKENLNTEVRKFFQHIEGNYHIGECKIIIQQRNECVDNKEWFYAETYVNDGEKEYVANFAITDGDSTASWLHIDQGQFHFRDYQRFERPRIYQAFSINFSPNMRKVKVNYKTYHMEYRPHIHREYHEIVRCKGPNPWVDLDNSAIFNEHKNILSNFLYNLKTALNKELQYNE